MTLAAMHLTDSSSNALISLLILCGILFIEECGVPLPILPGDGLLVAGGILVGTGRVPAVLFVAGATAAMGAGALIGHGWSYAVGPPLVGRIASRLHLGEGFDRARERLVGAGAGGVLIGRLIPGLRVYTNLAAGAAGMARRPFVAGMVPSVLAWVLGFGALGMLFGKPVERLLFATRGRLLLFGTLVCLALASILVARYLPPRRAPASTPRRSAGRLCAALLLDLGITASLISGCAELAEEVVRSRDRELPTLGLALLIGVGILAYFATSRRTAGRTAGEGLLGVSYRARRVH